MRVVKQTGGGEFGQRVAIGPSNEFRPVKVAGDDYMLGSTCKNQDCYDNTVVLLWSGVLDVVYGKVVQKDKSSLIGAPPPAVAAEHDASERRLVEEKVAIRTRRHCSAVSPWMHRSTSPTASEDCASRIERATETMKIHTIGFTQKTAEQFFEALRLAKVKRVVDVRLHNTSQLSGFAKQDDLRYFLDRITGIDYVHEPLLAPTDEMLSAYRKGAIRWEEYESRFVSVLASRRIEERLSKDTLDGSCLLCSEAKPHHCHRRLVAEFLEDRWGGIAVSHVG